MDFICFGMLILVVFHVEKSSECNTDDIVAFTGCNVSLKWTLRNIQNEADVFDIYNSLENMIASYDGIHDCFVRDKSSTSCKTNYSDDAFIILLTIFNVTERQSGIYTLRQTFPLEKQRSISTNFTVIDGPDNISLSSRERTFYLKEHEVFEIDCSANCYPNCIFWWKGPSDIPSKKLNISFELRMSGQYTCLVTNQETNSTIISDPITLHHAEDDVPEEQYWTGPIVVSVSLVIFGILMLVTVWRKNTIGTIDSRGLFQPIVGQRVSEVSGKELEGTNRLLHVPAMQVRLSRKTRIFQYPRNLQGDHYNTSDEDALSDYNHRIDNVMYEISHETRRSNEHVFYDYAHSIEMYHVETADVHATDETYITPISVVRSFEVFQDEETDVLETDHAYLTVIDDSVNPIEICQVEETDVKETDETYITPINGSESGSGNY